MGASEAHTYRRQRENQPAYFCQLSAKLWIVVLRFHLEDLNLDPTERERLAELMDARKGDSGSERRILRETHVYVTADGEKDQGMVQKILIDQANYLIGKGR